MSSQIAYALHRESNKVIHVSEAKRGLLCNCKCIECGSELEAIKGDVREHHFRHVESKTCTGETAIHLFAKQVIADNTIIRIPGRRLVYSNVRVENWLDTKRPDVTVFVEGENVHFEIRVSNAVKENKKQFYFNGKYKCVEIDLSDKEIWTLPLEELKEVILEKSYNKSIIYWEEQIEPLPKEGESLFEVFLKVSAFLILIVLSFKLLMPNKKY